MLKKYPFFSLLFVIMAISHLTAIAIGSSIVLHITKPLIVMSLLTMLAKRTALKGRFHKRLFMGLIFALAGDVLLMFVDKSQSFFLYGLIAFLVCHIFYTSAFYLDFRSAPELDKKGARIAIVICTLVGMGFYILIRANLGFLKLPVMAYIFVICFMMMMAVFRNQRVNMLSFHLVLYGAMLFMISDALLAYNKFVQPLDHASVWIMITYIAAQYLITMGAIERKLISVP